MTPQDLGLPQAAFRPGQFELAFDIANAPGPHDLLVAPTGFGKSLTYLTLAMLTGSRVCILTATRSLQDQLMADYADPIGLVDVRGQSNYICNAASDPSTGLGMFFRRGRHYTVRDAPCTRGIRCSLKDSGCSYYDRIREAASSQLVVTNYDFWFRNRSRLGRFDWLILDEAHLAPSELADFMSFRVTSEHRRVLKHAMPSGEDLSDWKVWLEWAVGFLQTKVEADSDPPQSLLDLRRDIERLESIVGQGDWVIEHDGKGGVAFDCVSPSDFGSTYLYSGVARVLLVSATVNAMTAKALGMPEGIRQWEAASSFPVNRRPVYPVRGAVRLNFRSSEGEKRMWSNLIDRILDSRPDRKGVIHTTSFERARYILAHSRHAKRLVLNDSSSTAPTIKRFTSSSLPLVLVSPSVTTGWDFPMSTCEFQIIGKIPFPDLRSKAAKIVNKRNPMWSGYSAAQTIVQASGRGMRSAEDQCETFIVDGNFDWWWHANQKFTPGWWQEAVQWAELSRLPAPPSPLSTRGVAHDVHV